MKEFEYEKLWLQGKIMTTGTHASEKMTNELRRRQWIIAGVLEHHIDLLLLLDVYKNHRRIDIVSNHYYYPQLLCRFN